MKRSGMTLLEILIVLSILAVLIAIIAPRILNSQKKADVNTAKVQLAGIESALKNFAVDNRTFPQTEEGLKALLEKPADEKRFKNWDGPYFEKNALPVDPWGNEFKYEYPSTHGLPDSPDVWSLGPDGEDKTEDDIVNWTTREDGENAGDNSSTSKKSNDFEPAKK
jgi:general secretion pathway protein G